MIFKKDPLSRLKDKFESHPSKNMDDLFWKKFHNEFPNVKETNSNFLPWYKQKLPRLSLIASFSVLFIVLVNFQKNSFQQDLLFSQMIQEEINHQNFLTSEDFLDNEAIDQTQEIEIYERSELEFTI